MAGVAVTGVGMVTPFGDARATWGALLDGGNAITEYGGEAVDVAGAVPEVDVAFDERRAENRLNAFGLAASLDALDDADINADVDAGVILGTAYGDPTESRFFSITGLPGMTSAAVAMELGLEGPTHAVSSACASGCHAIGEARQSIASGEIDVMLAGGVEAPLIPEILDSLASIRALTSSGDVTASRPLDPRRDGFVPSEGAGVLVLESPEHARDRDADPHAFLTGVGSSCDAHHVTSPHPDGAGAKRAMGEALDDAGLSDVDYVNAHATATPKGDVHEAEALHELLGSTKVYAPKAALGHAMGASGAIEAGISVLSLHENRVPPTINHASTDLECRGVEVPVSGESTELDSVLSNSFGFGGMNGSLVFESELD